MTVNAIAPGYIDTDMVAAVPEEVLGKIVAKIPVGRLGKAEEIARGVAFLVDENARLRHRLDAVDQRRPAHVLMAPDYAPPQKRSVLIAGHQTSISLEPMFWRALEAAARERGCPLNALVAEIDVARLDADAAAEPDLGDPAVAVSSGAQDRRCVKAAPPSGAWSRNSAGSISSSSMILSVAVVVRRRCRRAHRSPSAGAAASAAWQARSRRAAGRRQGHAAKMRLDAEVAASSAA